MCKTLFKITIDNIVFIVYNRDIIKERNKMNEKELKELQEAHDKAMEGIKAFNKSMNEAIDTTKDYLGVAK